MTEARDMERRGLALSFAWLTAIANYFLEALSSLVTKAETQALAGCAFESGVSALGVAQAYRCQTRDKVDRCTAQVKTIFFYVGRELGPSGRFSTHGRACVSLWALYRRVDFPGMIYYQSNLQLYIESLYQRVLGP